ASGPPAASRRPGPPASPCCCRSFAPRRPPTAPASATTGRPRCRRRTPGPRSAARGGAGCRDGSLIPSTVLLPRLPVGEALLLRLLVARQECLAHPSSDGLSDLGDQAGTGWPRHVFQ